MIFISGGQRVSMPCWILPGLIGLFVASTIIAVQVTPVSDNFNWLRFTEYAEYVKLVISFIKYIPQAFMNFVRRSTVGWSIGNVLLDFTGGLLSTLQQGLQVLLVHTEFHSVHLKL